MNERYTKEDVIIWPDDPRLKDAVGTKIYADDTPTGVLYKANNDKESFPLSSIRLGCLKPFTATFCYWPCIIIKKEPKKKLVPFDFRLEEDKAKVRGKYIKVKNGYGSSPEYLCTGFNGEHVFLMEEEFTPLDLLMACTFLDGSPCGKEVEE